MSKLFQNPHARRRMRSALFVCTAGAVFYSSVPASVTNRLQLHLTRFRKNMFTRPDLSGDSITTSLCSENLHLKVNDEEEVKLWYTNNLEKVRKNLFSPDMKTNPNILFQFSLCPFCSKVRCFLRTHGIPFTMKEVDPIIASELKHKTYKKVPQLQIGGTVKSGPLLVDSTEIGSILGSVLKLPHPSDTDLWRKWANDVLCRYITLLIGTSLRDSSWFIMTHPELNFATKTKYIGAGIVMFLTAHRMVAPKLKALGYETKNVQHAMLQELMKWGERLKESTNLDLVSHQRISYHGGNRPSLADTDVFGVLQCVKHHRLYKKIVEQGCAASPALDRWFAAMNQSVYDSRKVMS